MGILDKLRPKKNEDELDAAAARIAEFMEKLDLAKTQLEQEERKLRTEISTELTNGGPADHYPRTARIIEGKARVEAIDKILSEAMNDAERIRSATQAQRTEQISKLDADCLELKRKLDTIRITAIARLAAQYGMPLQLPTKNMGGGLAIAASQLDRDEMQSIVDAAVSEARQSVPDEEELNRLRAMRQDLWIVDHSGPGLGILHLVEKIRKKAAQ